MIASNQGGALDKEQRERTSFENSEQRRRSSSLGHGREENGIKELAKKDLDPALQARLVYLHTKGTGRIPVAFASGASDMAGILDKFGNKLNLLHAAQVLPKQENLVHEFDRTWPGSIEDLPAESVTIQYSKMLINYFPAAGHIVMLVNATKLVQVPLQLIKPIMADHLDLEVHGKDEDDVTVVSHILKLAQLRELQAKAKEMLELI